MAVLFRVDPHQRRDSESIGDKHVFGVVAEIVAGRLCYIQMLTAGHVEQV